MFKYNAIQHVDQWHLILSNKNIDLELDYNPILNIPV